MLKRWLGSGMLAAAISAVGINRAEKIEKRLAGGKALSVRGLIARHTVMAAIMLAMKQRRSKAN